MGGGHYKDCGPQNLDRVCRSYTADCGHVTPGAGSGMWGHSGDCAGVTLGTGSGEKCHPRNFGNVTPGTAYERKVTEKTVDL